MQPRINFTIQKIVACYMAGKYVIGAQVLAQMILFLDNQRYLGQTAPAADLQFITDGEWLGDAAVIGAMNSRNGVWDICMVFAHHKNPLQIIVRHITQCFSKQKAEVTAFYICKEAAKDSRGTLTVSINDLGLCCN